MQTVHKIVAACLLATPCQAFDQATHNKTMIAIEDAPTALLDVAEETAPGVEFSQVMVKEEIDTTIYEFQAQDYAGRHVEVDVVEDGTIEKIEIEISEEEVPEAVQETLKQTVPGFAPQYVEFSVRNNGDEFIYEFLGEHEGEMLDLEIKENGSLLSSPDENSI